MKSKIQWLGDSMTFIAKTESGHVVAMDSSPEFGGENIAPRPMELLLAGMGGCSAIDVIMILKKSRQNIIDCTVTIDAKRADTDPKVFTDINMHFVLVGKNIDSKKAEQAIALSHEKYCSASIMLGKTANIKCSFSVVEYT
jgi:putative redox protein